MAPFTSEQVRHLNEFQRSGAMHPFTCADHSNHSLVATEEGWTCPKEGCEYKQNWAHVWMADGSAVAARRVSIHAHLQGIESSEILAVNELEHAVHRVAAAAAGDSNDEEIEALQNALDLALRRWPEITQ